MVLRTILTGLPLVIVPAVAAEPAATTGITSIGPAMFLFTLAAALVLTLVFQRSAAALTRFAMHRLGDFRIRRALARESEDVLHDFVLPGAYGGLVRIDHAAMTTTASSSVNGTNRSGPMSTAPADGVF